MGPAEKREGKKGAEWDGVRNFQARNHMRAMKKGDLGFFYETGDAKAGGGHRQGIEGSAPRLDRRNRPWECVDVVAVTDLPRPVTLAEVKATPTLKDMVLVARIAAVGAAGFAARMEY